MAKLGELKVMITASTKAFSKAMGELKGSLAKFGKGIVSLPGLAAVGGAGFAAKELLNVADAYVNLDARLTNLLGTAQESSRAQDLLFEASQRTGTSVLANSEALTKLQIASGMTGLTIDQNIEVLEGLNKIFRLSGASALDTSIAMRQLGQALASGRLQGDEFRSIAEATPRLLVKLSEQLGVAVGDLKKMGSEGELTSDKLGQAFLNISRSGDVAFTDLPKTSAAAFQRIINSAQKLWDHINDNTGLITFIAESFDELAVWVEQNESRFIEWAKELKSFLINDFPVAFENAKDGFFKLLKDLEEFRADVKFIFGEIKTLIVQLTPVWEMATSVIGKFTDNYGKFLSIISKVHPLTIGAKALRAWLSLFQSIKGLFTGGEAVTAGPATAEGAAAFVGAQRMPSGGGTVINNNITEKFNRSDLARLNTDQARQAARS